MANSNYRPCTAQGVSKIYLFLGIPRETYSSFNEQNQFDENISSPNHFTTLSKAVYSSAVTAKSVTEPGNSNIKTLANKSTPLNRAIFVCSLRTPKENAKTKSGFCYFLSMVACSGKGIALCYVPKFVVFQPVTRYRPQAWKLHAVALQKLNFGAITMKAYSFLCVNLNTETYQEQIVRIIADSEQNARFKLTADYRLLLSKPIARINLNLTACNQAQGGIYA